MGVDVISTQGDDKTAGDREPDQFLGVLLAEGETNQQTPPWMTTVTLNNREVVFKIDTGADVTVIPETSYVEEQDGKLEVSDRVLRGAGQQPLSVWC